MDITETCLDAEALAAWVDGGLSRSEMARAVAHVAGCARCQALLGTLVRLTPAAADAKIAAASRRWISWAVPLAAAAAAVVVWITIPRSQLQELQPPPMRPASQPAVPQAQGRAASSPPPPSLPPAAPAPADTPRLASPPRAAELRKDAGVPADSVAAPAPPPAADTASANAAPSTNAAASARMTFAERAAAPEIVSPDPLVRWRVAGTNIQRSVDGGGTWTTTLPGTTATLLAGDAPSSTVVWIVGSNGAVLLSTDGLTWRRLAFPDGGDLVSVQAKDARAATLTVRDGRKFSTTDAGATWVPGALQGF